MDGEHQLITKTGLLQLPRAARKIPGYPPVFALVPLTAVYSGIGYILTQDLEAGSSTASAWGLIYLSVFGKGIWQSKRFGPMVSAGYIGLSTLGYLHEFWVE